MSPDPSVASLPTIPVRAVLSFVLWVPGVCMAANMGVDNTPRFGARKMPGPAEFLGVDRVPDVADAADSLFPRQSVLREELRSARADSQQHDPKSSSFEQEGDSRESAAHVGFGLMSLGTTETSKASSTAMPWRYESAEERTAFNGGEGLRRKFSFGKGREGMFGKGSMFGNKHVWSSWEQGVCLVWGGGAVMS